VTFKIVQLVELKHHTEGRAKTEVDACDMDDTGKWVRFGEIYAGGSKMPSVDPVLSY